MKIMYELTHRERNEDWNHVNDHQVPKDQAQEDLVQDDQVHEEPALHHDVQVVPHQGPKPE